MKPLRVCRLRPERSGLTSFGNPGSQKGSRKSDGVERGSQMGSNAKSKDPVTMKSYKHKLAVRISDDHETDFMIRL
jgi:hypothetical protein